MEQIIINWTGPYSLTELPEYEVVDYRGIYAIYRTFGGNETLLYIGSTTRTFFERMNEHNKDWLYIMRGQISFRFGVPEFAEGKRYSKKKLLDIESMLICYHKPQENTMSVNFYRGRDNLTVISRGQMSPFIKRKISSVNDFE